MTPTGLLKFSEHFTPSQAFACLAVANHNPPMTKAVDAHDLIKLVETRREKLRLWFDERPIPSEEKSYISQLMSGKSAFGEKAARRLETTYSMPAGYLDIATGEEGDKVTYGLPPMLMSHDRATTSLTTGDTREPLPVTTDEFVIIPAYENRLGGGNTAILEDYDRVAGGHAYTREWIEKNGFSIPLLAVVTVTGDSMVPYVFDGNKVLIYLGFKRIIDGEHYAVRIGDEPKIKRLFTQGDGRVRVESYNAPVDYIGRGDDAEVLGIVVDRKGTSRRRFS